MAAARSPGPLLLLLLTALCWGAYGTDDFSLEDAVDGIPTKKPDPKPPGKPSFGSADPKPPGKPSFGSADPKPPRKPSSGSDDFNLDDYFDTPSKTTTKRPRTTTKSPAKKTDQSIWNLLDVTTTKSPKTNKPVPQNKPGFSDSDLADILDDGSYKPDKKKGGDGGGDSASDSMAETGTIAGIASALAMALIGAVSSYISYQQKKFCFSIQQGLNAEYVKGENMEGVVTEEPPVKYTALDMQASEPPPYEHPKI
ncbi:CD99 antigen-like protein 2 isoform X3 [Microcaecilia unicolor]|uniref:CD99 antigen-like protein 2 n=1 Tax=Microcaecilia unicolor TaxID=1415580 RepID=A0A6P7YP09_9AMPH|nr:CD99 antigen-like protein 2 isoform X3 [Microcaecilia unicolor]